MSTRRLRIVKYRGTTHGTSEYPFLIDERGISVMPVTALHLDHAATVEETGEELAQNVRSLGFDLDALVAQKKIALDHVRVEPAEIDEIVAIPTLVRKLPAPLRKVIGDLSNEERALVGLQLRPRKGEAA